MGLKPKRSWLTTISRALLFAVVILDPKDHTLLKKAQEKARMLDEVIPKDESGVVIIELLIICIILAPVAIALLS